MNNIKITPLLLENVLIDNTINTNNLGAKPDDFDEMLNRGNTKNWIEKFHTNYKVLTLTDTKWLQSAQNIGSVTGRFPLMYKDDLDDLIAKTNNMTWLNNDWFVRTENVSLKDSMHGVGPYNSIEKVIQGLVTSSRVIITDNLKLYFIPFLQIDLNQEFRVFVYNNKITAISQQHIYTPNMFLTQLYKENKLENYIQLHIISHFNNINDKLANDTYTMDYAVNDNKPYFIEQNSWGAQYAAGSALFGWIKDHDILHGNNKIEFRFVLNNN